jgi:hypothetical protein
VAFTYPNPTFQYDYNINATAATGWQCPRCHMCFAPSVMICTNCKPYTDESDDESVFLVTPENVNMTPNELRELQDALNAMAGEIKWKHKIIVLPPKSTIQSERDV